VEGRRDCGESEALRMTLLLLWRRRAGGLTNINRMVSLQSLGGRVLFLLLDFGQSAQAGGSVLSPFLVSF
jgi:hypothetical protein